MALRAVRGESSPLILSDFHEPWKNHLRAEAKAKGTIEKYLMVLRMLEAFLTERGYSLAVVEIQKPQLAEFISATLETHKSSTAATRFFALRAFFGYLLAEEEIRWDPMAGLKPPPSPAPPVPVIRDDAMERLLAACKGNDFEARRDTAVLLMFFDTGARLSEITNLQLGDVHTGFANVIGKGSKPRAVRFGATTARALDRYLRVRSRHEFGHTSALWLGRKGPMTRWGIRDIVEKRAEQAGIGHLHPHMFRHSFAHNWLASGGQENDLMRLAGWSSRSMTSRYGASAADERAAEAYNSRPSPADRLKGGGK